eukprot:154896_1
MSNTKRIVDVEFIACAVVKVNKKSFINYNFKFTIGDETHYLTSRYSSLRAIHDSYKKDNLFQKAFNGNIPKFPSKRLFTDYTKPKNYQKRAKELENYFKLLISNSLILNNSFFQNSIKLNHELKQLMTSIAEQKIYPKPKQITTHNNKNSKQHTEQSFDHLDPLYCDKNLTTPDTDKKNEYELEYKPTWLSVEQVICLENNGYCPLDMNCNNILFVCNGYIRLYHESKQLFAEELILQIATYYGGKYNANIYVQLVSCEELVNKQGRFLVSHNALKLCNLYTSIVAGTIDSKLNTFPVKKVKNDILGFVCKYLGHHNGIKPEEIAKPIRSVKMERICADKWDANYINKLNKKRLFQLILAANYMDIPSLLHLGCAKIATLIKGKSPEEIKNILANDGTDNENENEDKNEDENKDKNENDDDDDENIPVLVKQYSQ